MGLFNIKNVFPDSNENNKTAAQLNEELVHGFLGDLGTTNKTNSDPNPRLNSYRPRNFQSDITNYATCIGTTVKYYLQFLDELSSSVYTKHIGKQGTKFNIRTLINNIKKVSTNPNLNFLTYGIGGYGAETNPIINLDFFIFNDGEQEYVCCEINFLWELLQNYSLEDNTLNEFDEANAFNKAMLSGKLFLPSSFTFSPDLCRDRNTMSINPYQWGCYTLTTLLEPTFVKYVRSLSSN